MDSNPTPYQVIARKYRPQTFSDVVGQEATVTTLKNALRFNRLAHAYLFCGCRGTGKTTFARLFAKALNCGCPTEDFEPCNSCPSCLDINAGRSLDVLEIDGASNRGIDDIRGINETVGYAPASGKYKIYIIDEVHMLTKEAFNALLKTLEEPPANVKFFFATTEPHKVLPTIVSRCQRFDLNRIPLDALQKKLSWIANDLNIPCEQEVFSLIANLAEGSLRDAESLLDQILCYAEQPITVAKVSATLGLMPRTAFFDLDAAFEEQNLSFAFELAYTIFSSGKDLSFFLDNLIEHYCALLKLKLGAFVAFPSTRLQEQYAASLSRYTEEQCLYILDFLIQSQQQIGKTPFKRFSLEMILLHILRSKNRVALPTLVKRLAELEHKLACAPQAEAAAPPIAEQPTPLEVAAEVSLTPVDLPPQAEAPAPLPVEPQDTSVEESLMKKIKEKIAAAPPLIDAEIPDETPAPPIVLSKSQWEAAAASAAEVQHPSPSAEAPVSPQSRYDTLLRFAAVELEGVIKKES